MYAEDYKLFGLDASCTIAEAKTAYYNLALLIHPDRNISINKEEACKEMCSLTNSYKNIINDIKNKNRKDEIVNCENLKLYHQKNQLELDNDIKNMSSFSDIFFETHDDFQNFNKKWFEKNNKSKNEIDENQYIINLKNGYNICKSEYLYIKSNDELEYSTEIILDKDYTNFNYSKDRQIISIDNLNSNNINNHTDYKEAFQPKILDNMPLSIISEYSLNEKTDIIKEFENRQKQYLENTETKKQKNFIKNLRKIQ